MPDYPNGFVLLVVPHYEPSGQGSAGLGPLTGTEIVRPVMASQPRQARPVSIPQTPKGCCYMAAETTSPTEWSM